MDKQEALQKAYEQYPELLQFTNENGWCSNFNDEEKPYMPEEVIDIEVFNGYEYYRPISLRGIENNNGWLKIQSEADLPKDTVQCYVRYKNLHKTGSEIYSPERKCFDCFLEVTHYQPVIIPPPPIY